MAPLMRTGGQVIVEALERAGAKACFGVPGESFMGILDALHDSSIEFVSTRHEGGAAFMASGYSKATGRIGVCLGTRAVGTANMSIGLHDARQDSTPLIAIVGDVARRNIGREGFQEADLAAAMAPFTKWAVRLPSADAASEIMARVVNVARSGRPGPVFVSVPQDVCDEVTTIPSASLTQVTAPAPDIVALSLALDELLKANRPLVFAGGGVIRSLASFDRLVAFAEAAEIPVITSWRRHDGFPNDHRLYLGCASLGAAPVVWERIADTDTLLVLGNRMQEISTAGYELPAKRTKILQIDIEPTVMINHRQPDMAIQADGGKALQMMLDLLQSPAEGVARRRARNQADRARFEAATTLPRANSLGSGLQYAEVFQIMAAQLGPDSLISSDAGNFYGWLARYYRFLRQGTYIGPASGAMGYGLPAAVGAKIGNPERTVVSLSGDGGFMMTMAELETAVRYEANVTAIVLDNSRHGTIRMHQEREHPGRVIGTELAPTNLLLVAQGLGASGYLAEDRSQFEEALQKSLVAEAPSLIQVRVDRDQLSVDRRLDKMSENPR